MAVTATLLAVIGAPVALTRETDTWTYSLSGSDIVPGIPWG